MRCVNTHKAARPVVAITPDTVGDVEISMRPESVLFFFFHLHLGQASTGLLLRNHSWHKSRPHLYAQSGIRGRGTGDLGQAKQCQGTTKTVLKDGWGDQATSERRTWRASAQGRPCHRVSRLGP